MLLDDAVNGMPIVKTRYDLKPRLHNTTCCQTGCQTALTNGCIVYTAGCQTVFVNIVMRRVLWWSAVVCGSLRWSAVFRPTPYYALTQHKSIKSVKSTKLHAS